MRVIRGTPQFVVVAAIQSVVWFVKRTWDAVAAGEMPRARWLNRDHMAEQVRRILGSFGDLLFWYQVFVDDPVYHGQRCTNDECRHALTFMVEPTFHTGRFTVTVLSDRPAEDVCVGYATFDRNDVLEHANVFETVFGEEER